MRRKFLIVTMCAAISIFIYGCAQPPEVSVAQPDPLNNTPDLSAYTRFEIFSQSSVATGQSQAVGHLVYQPKSSQFDVFDEAKVMVGRLHVQPDACRDDPSQECRRRFTIAGRIQSFGASMNCTAPVRNDIAYGYAQQTVSGICQNQYGRSFTLNIYAK